MPQKMGHAGLREDTVHEGSHTGSWLLHVHGRVGDIGSDDLLNPFHGSCSDPLLSGVRAICGFDIQSHPMNGSLVRISELCSVCCGSYMTSIGPTGVRCSKS